MRPQPIFALIALLTALTPLLAAQKAPAHPASPAHSAIPHFNLPAANIAFGQTARPFGFRRSSPYTSLPFPFFGDSFNLDDLYSSGYPVASQPPVFLLQAASALAGPAEYLGHSDFLRPGNITDPSSSQPLMIELQNGSYVRVTSKAADGEALPLAFSPNQAHSKSASIHSAQPPEKVVITRDKAVIPSSQMPVIPSEARDLGFASTAQSQPRELPSVLLIFRDGHSQEVRDYTIADGILYARGDYYTDGYWNKTIALTTLNISETLQANNERNVKFILPASPNEVITRP
jgi:hypothetical protein